jgi:two-component system CheB/CheR fusion protein
MKTPSTPKKSHAKAEVKENTFPVVAIGASAGGLEAMMELLKYLPADTGMAFIYVQHLSPDHKSMLTEILSKKTKMIVQEIDDMDKIQPDNLFVIPYNKGIEVTDGHIKLIPRSETSAAITIDILFSTLAEAQKERVIGVVLSGSASDGTVGMKTIKQQGGLTFAQDDTAKFNSMPHSAIAAGAVDFILSPKEIALELGRLSKHPLLNPPSGGRGAGVKNGEEDLIENSNPDLKTILNQLHKATGVDFSAYKMNTIKRRIIRRMLLYKITQLKEYAKLLSQKKEEIDILYQDLLINVTSFFRDTDTHKYLKETLFPKLLKRKKIGESMRIWVPACATGEEAYSIAIMLLEIQESKATSTPIQIFASDLSEQAISKARIGVYTKQDLETVSPKRIQRFFNKADGGFRINKEVRDMCVFAPHNILHDPPFSRLDFISCCNLFIYFDNPAQKKAVTTFHYALNEDGFLMLGKSENITHSANLFTGFNKKYKLFSRKKNSGTRTLPALLPRYAPQTFSGKTIPVTNKNKTTQTISVNHSGLDNAIDAVLVSEFMPASVVISHQMEIVQFRGSTDLFLTHPKGKATFNILKMARPEIAFELRNTIAKVIKTKHRIRKSGIEMKINSAVKIISLEVVPLKIESDEPLLLILFTELEQTEIYSLNPPSGGRGASLAKDRRIKKLEQELAAAHADALAIAQEQEAFTEELQSANEEVVSSNEELQTVNEELETSKEEIESANEELTTTNQELQTRNDLLNESYEYSQAITATIHEAMIVLDKNLRIKSANISFYKIFKVKEEETEGVFLFDLGNKQWNIPSLREFLQEIVPKNSHFHDFEVAHNFPQIGEKIMLLNASRIIQKRHGEELILLSINDVTEVRKKALEVLGAENKYLSRFQRLLLQTPVAIAIYRGSNYIAELVNDLALELLNKDKNLIGKPLFQSMPELESQLKPAFDKVMQSGIPFLANEFEATLLRNGKNEKTYFNTIFEPIREDDNTISGVIVVATEVTEQVLSRKKVADSEKRYNMMLMNSPFGFAIFKGKNMVITLANDSVKEMWGKSKDLEGKPLFDVIPELKDSEFPGLLDKVYTTGVPFYGEELLAPVFRHGKLEDVYFNFVYQPYLEADETISGVTVIAYEVTTQIIAKKKIEESERRFRNLVEKAPYPICIFKEKELKLEVANEPMLKIFNVGEEALDKPFLEILPEMKEQPFIALLLDVLENEATHYGSEQAAYFLRENGEKETYYFNFVYQPYRENDRTVSGVMVLATDVTEQVLARKIIEDSDKRYNMMLMNSPFTFAVLKGKDLIIDLANDQIKEVWGLGNDIEGKSLLEIMPELKDTTFIDLLDKVRTTGIPFHGIEVESPKNMHGNIKEEYFFNFVFQPYMETDQTISGITIIGNEVTEQVLAKRKIEESERKFKQLAELMPQKVWTADAEGHKTYFNQTLLDYAGMSSEELNGDKWKQMIHPDDWEQDEMKWKKSIKTGEIYQSESRFLRHDGKYLWHLTIAVPLKDDKGEIVLWIGSKTEIEKQRKQKEKLEEAVEGRTSELKQANEELKKMNKELEAFAYVSSHDLQEPLRKIRTMAGRILEKENQNLSDSGKNYFHLMQNAAERMQTLIQDLLAFSRLSMADRKFETTDLNIIIEEVKKEFKDTIAEKNAFIEVKEICEVKIIPFQFRQLMHNLISNALKFSNPEIPPHIKISSVNKTYSEINQLTLTPHKEYCHISISDNGIGFEKEFAEKIFEVFQKLHPKDEYSGTGIGLAIVKKIVENHDGIITATSELKKGTTFNIYIPI